MDMDSAGIAAADLLLVTPSNQTVNQTVFRSCLVTPLSLGETTDTPYIELYRRAAGGEETQRFLGTSVASRQRQRALLSVGRFCRELQLPIDLIQKVLGLLGVTMHIPFIGFLRRDDLIEGLLAQPLRGCQLGCLPREMSLSGWATAKPARSRSSPANPANIFFVVSNDFILTLLKSLS